MGNIQDFIRHNHLQLDKINAFFLTPTVQVPDFVNMDFKTGGQSLLTICQVKFSQKMKQAGSELRAADWLQHSQ